VGAGGAASLSLDILAFHSEQETGLEGNPERAIGGKLRYSPERVLMGIDIVGLS